MNHTGRGSKACGRATRLEPHDWPLLTKESIAHAVERHAAKDPGVRGTLKRASAACHPSQNATRLTLIRRIISIRYTTKHHDKDCTGHRHERCEERDGTRTRTRCDPTSNSGDTGDDVAMEEENEGERSAGDSNPSGPDSRRKITTEREPREARHEQSIATSQNVPRRMSGKTQGHAAAVTTQEASDGSREKTMSVANIENRSLNWVSISSAGALDLTNCDFSERRARDEMRHIIGSSEPDVMIGSDKDRSRGCKKHKDHIEFLCELCEAQAAQGRYFVHELTSEASSRMECVVKIMAMPGTRAAIADLCERENTQPCH